MPLLQMPHMIDLNVAQNDTSPFLFSYNHSHIHNALLIQTSDTNHEIMEPCETMAHHNCYLLQHYTCSAHIGPTGDNIVTMLCQLYVARAKKKKHLKHVSTHLQVVQLWYVCIL